jgi:hypothetical protein
MKQTFIEALAKWAIESPDKLAWAFHNDKLELSDSVTYLVSWPLKTFKMLDFAVEYY